MKYYILMLQIDNDNLLSSYSLIVFGAIWYYNLGAMKNAGKWLMLTN